MASAFSTTWTAPVPASFNVAVEQGAAHASYVVASASDGSRVMAANAAGLDARRARSCWQWRCRSATDILAPRRAPNADHERAAGDDEHSSSVNIRQTAVDSAT